MATLPRFLYPGQMIHISRRCVEGTYLLTPDEEFLLSILFLQVLQLALHKYGLKLHALVVMSNHYHAIVTDDTGKVELPEFCSWFNAQFAKRLNKLIGRKGSVWDKNSYTCTEIIDMGGFYKELGYMLANPVKHGAVQRPEQWPGIITLPDQLGDRIELPELPDHVELPYVPLSVPHFFEGSLNQYREEAREAMERSVEHKQQIRADRGLGYRGVEWIQSRSRRYRPGDELSDEELATLQQSDEDDEGENVDLKESKSVASGQRKDQQERLRERKCFYDSYKASMNAWKKSKDKSKVEFPYGTYKMRVVHGARVAAPGH